MRFTALILLCLLLFPASAEERFDPRSLASGGYVVYFRHASATLGRDCKDPRRPAWWKSRDALLTRQLDPAGQEQSATLGRAIKALGIRVDEILASEFTRCQETARAFDLGPVTTSRSLTPLVYSQDFEERLNREINKAPAPGTIRILVAHGHVIPAFEGLAEGDAAVFLPGDEGPRLVGFISFEDWVSASRP